VVVVDEASMVDLAMMAKLVDAVRPAAKLVLLGDRNQLASVDAGTVLADLCGPTSGRTLALPDDVRVACEDDLAVHGLDAEAVAVGRPLQGSVIQLNKTFRFRDDSGIGAFARACLADEVDAEAAAALLDDPSWPDVQRLPWPDGTGLGSDLTELVRAGYRPALDTLLGGFDPARDGCVEAFHRRVLDALDGFRVLCAHRRGRAGVAGVNREIGALLVKAHPALTAQGPRAWLGRPVLVTENAYAVGRFNGDVGLGVTREGHPSAGALVVAFPGPDALPSDHTPPAEVARQVAAGELRLVEYLDPARLPAWQPVYAMTIHKSQGSEFGHAVVVLPERRSPILTRELIYTGVTRAKDQVTLVGARDVLEAALERPVRRASGLLDLLWADAAAIP
jgi:exodeoxyribonuclease V alpha subunit